MNKFVLFLLMAASLSSCSYLPSWMYSEDQKSLEIEVKPKPEVK